MGIIKPYVICFFKRAFVFFFFPSVACSVIPLEYSSIEMQEHLAKDQVPKKEVPGRIHKMEYRDFWLNELKPPPMI